MLLVKSLKAASQIYFQDQGKQIAYTKQIVRLRCYAGIASVRFHSRFTEPNFFGWNKISEAKKMFEVYKCQLLRAFQKLSKGYLCKKKNNKYN